VGLNRVVLGATDGQLWGYQDFVINVTNANDAPVIQSMPVAAALQGAPYKYQVQAFDPDGDDITYYLSAWPTNMSIDPVGGLISWVPASDQVGPAFVRLEVMDGHGGVSNQSFYIMVANVNDPPVISSASPSPASEGTPWTFRLAAWDPDGDQVNFSLLSAPYGMILNSSSWQLEWVPGQETVGRNQVVLLASDGLGGLAVQSLTVIVQDVNDPPVALGSIAPDAFQGQPYITHVNAYDPDGDTLTYSLVTQLPNMAIDRHTGVLVWYPARPQVGDYHIAVRISDLNGSYTDAIFNVTVHPSNDPPEVGPLGVLRATAGARLRFRVPASDPNGDRLLFTSTSRLFRINATTGEISFVPGDDDVGTHEFSVDVIDAGGLNATTSGVIVISGRPAGMPPARLAGYGLAGLGGFTPWLIIVIMITVLGLLVAESVRLRRLELLEEKAAAQAEAPEVPAIPGVAPAQGHKIRAAQTGPVAYRSWQRAAVQPKVKRIKKVKGLARCGLCGREISIKTGSDNYACSCGAWYHSKCFQKAGICPECGRGRNERGKKA